MQAYLDSSALLRKIFAEPGALPRLAAGRSVLSSRILEVECLRTLDRMRLTQGLSSDELSIRGAAVHSALRKLSLVEVTIPVLDRAKQPFPTALGTLDAIHLATAALWREQASEDIVLLTHDTAMARAARAIGIPVEGA